MGDQTQEARAHSGAGERTAAPQDARVTHEEARRALSLYREPAGVEALRRYIGEQEARDAEMAALGELCNKVVAAAGVDIRQMPDRIAFLTHKLAETERNQNVWQERAHSAYSELAALRAQLATAQTSETPTLRSIGAALDAGRQTFTAAEVQYALDRCREARSIVLDDGWVLCESCDALIDTGSDAHTHDPDEGYWCAQCSERAGAGDAAEGAQAGGREQRAAMHAGALCHCGAGSAVGRRQR